MNDKIKSIIAEITGITVDDETPLADQGIDSLDAVEIALELEEEFGIEISDDELWETVSDTATLADIVRIVEGKVQE
jgi:acyl carrier protein